MSAYTVSRAAVGRQDYRYVRKVRAGSTVPMVLLGEPKGRGGAEEEWEEEYYYEDDAEGKPSKTAPGRPLKRLPLKWSVSEVESER